MSYLRRQALLLTQSQQARNPLPPLMESEDWENPPTPPPKDARYTTDNSAMDGDVGSRPASGSKRKRAVQEFDNTIYERRNGRLEAVDGDEDKPTPQKRSRSHAGGRSTSTYSDTDDATRLRRKRAFGNLSNMNLRHAAATAFRSESPTRESRFQEGSLNDKPSQQPPSVFTRIARTDSGNLQQVDELMNDYHDGMATPRDSTEDYVKETIEYEKATMPARVAEITERRNKEEGKKGMFRFGKSFTNTFHPVQLWNRMWSESKEELIAKNRLEAERKAREKAEIQARYDQMKRDGQFNAQHVPFAGRADVIQTQDSVMVDTEAGDQQRADSHGDADSVNGSEIPDLDDAVPTTATKSRFPGFHFKTPSISNLKDTFRSVRSVRSHSALGGAIERDSTASASVSPAKADLSTLKRSVSRFDLKKERRLSNRVSDLESKLNKARLELKNALDDASPMPKLGSRYERFTPVGTMKRSRFVPGALASLPSERLLFPEMTAPDANSEQVGRSTSIEARPRSTLELNSGMDIEKLFNNYQDEDNNQQERTAKAPRETGYPARATEAFQPVELDSTMIAAPIPDNVPTLNMTEQASANPADAQQGAKEEIGKVAIIDQTVNNAALATKFSTLEASIKATNKPAKHKKRKSGAADDEKPYRSDGEAEESESEETLHKKKRKSGGKTANKKKTSGAKAGGKTSLPVPVVESKSKKSKGKKTVKAVDNFFTNGKLVEDDEDSTDELATTVPASADSDVQSLEPVYEEEEEVTTIPLKDEPSKPTAKSTPARYGRDVVRSHPSSPHKKRSDSLQPVVDGLVDRAGQVAHQRRTGGRSPPPNSKRAEVVDDVVVAVPGENGVPRLPMGAQDKSNWNWPADVF